MPLAAVEVETYEILATDSYQRARIDLDALI